MIEYEETWLFPVLFRWRGSVYWRAALFAIPGAMLSLGIIYFEDIIADLSLRGGLAELGQSTLWSGTTAVLLFVVGFRTKQGYSRFWEGTGLLHQMKGEWFDTVSNCVTFSISAKKDNDDDVWKFRHTIVRLMSLCHASALEEISGLDSELETIDIRGLDDGTLRHLKDCVEVHGFNKVEVLLHLIQSLIAKAHDDDLLKVPAPILSRVFQTCSRGYVNLLNTKKITDTKFPFPFVQLITFLLLIHTVLTPMMLSCLLSNAYTASFLTFMILFGVYSLNFISIELENPFGEDDNDLPLVHFQTEMNSCLLMLLHYNTDIIAGTSNTCIKDFQELKATMILSREDQLTVGSLARAQAFFCGGSDPGPLKGFKKPSRRLSEVGIEVEVAEARNLSVEVAPCVSAHSYQASVQSYESETASETGPIPYSATLAGGIAAPLAGPVIHSGSVTGSGASPALGLQHDRDDRAAVRPAPSKDADVGSLEFCTCTSVCSCKAKSVGAFREPKLVQGHGSPPLENMEEFNHSMQCWTQMMENQLKDLSRSFTNLNRLSQAVPAHSGHSEVTWIA